MAETFEAPEVVQAMAEVTLGERIVEIEDYGKVKMRFPNAKERQQADLAYSEKFTELLDGNLKTRSEMEAILKKRGVWTDKDDAELERLDKIISYSYTRQLEAEGNRTARKKIIEERKEARGKATDMRVKKETLMANTIESKCEEIRTGMIISAVCTKADSGEKVWPTYDDYISDVNYVLIGTIYREWLSFSNGLPSNFLDGFLAELDELDENGESDGNSVKNSDTSPSKAE